MSWLQEDILTCQAVVEGVDKIFEEERYKILPQQTKRLLEFRQLYVKRQNKLKRKYKKLTGGGMWPVADLRR